MLAALWDRPQATFASEVLILQGRARVTREIDAGQEILEVDLPAVITADLRLNEPRFVKLPDMIKAKRKTLEILPLTELAMENGNQLRYLRYSSPPPRPNKTMVQDVPALLQAMKDRGAMG
jgi:electron transfer flavoprotein beta subunit